MKNNFIILLCGKSGVGKSTIVSVLRNKYGYRILNSYTTRKKRYDNEEGHIFITNEEFNKFNKDDFVAYTYFDNNHYFATKKQVEENEIYIIDSDGINYFKNKYDGNKKVIIISLDASNELLKKRMKIRGDSTLMINNRIKNDKDKFSKLDGIVINVKENDTSNDIANKIYEIIKTEC